MKNFSFIRKKLKDQHREPRDYFHGSLKAGTLSCSSFALVSSLPRNYSCNSRDECCFGVDIKRNGFYLCARLCALAPFKSLSDKKSERKRHPATCTSEKILNYSQLFRALVRDIKKYHSTLLV